jgi:mersacidin/lichenicidin family type 2 lantibiotic
MSKIDIARATKDPTYFATLSEDEKSQVRAANPVGEAKLDDKDLDSVSGGLEGGDKPESTTTTTNLSSCTCAVDAVAATSASRTVASLDCSCSC